MGDLLTKAPLGNNSKLINDKAISTPTTSENNNPNISFSIEANRYTVSQYSLNVLKDILIVAKLKSALITSTARTPEDQARIMYDNCETNGPESQKALYANAGDQVIDVYVSGKMDNKSKEDIISEMLLKINTLGASSVSKHVADPKEINVIDIAPSSIVNKDSFVSAVESERRVNKFLKPPLDPAYHLEIPQI